MNKHHVSLCGALRSVFLAFLFAFSFLSQPASAQKVFEGTEWWGIGANSTAGPVNNKLVIISDYDNIATIEYPKSGSPTLSVPIAAGSYGVITVQGAFGLNGGETNSGFRLTTCAPAVVLLVHTLALTGDAYPLIPLSALGKSYIISVHEELTNTISGCSAVAIATEDSTKVTFLVRDTTEGSSPKTIPDTVVVMLDKGQTFQVVEYTNTVGGRPDSTNVSGTEVIADKPIAVLAVSRLAVDCGSYDDGVEQMPPVGSKLWGTRFITAQPTPRRAPKIPPNTSGVMSDYIEVHAGAEGAAITVNGIPHELKPFHKYLHIEPVGSVTPPPLGHIDYGEANCIITSDKPVLVQQYRQGRFCDEPISGAGNTYKGDPNVCNIVPEALWEKEYLVAVAGVVGNYPENYMTILIKDEGSALSSLKMNAVPLGLAGWIPMQNSNYKYNRIAISNATYRLTCDSAFTVYVQGNGDAVSYGLVNGAPFSTYTPPLPDADAGNDVTLCYGESTQLKASGGATYSWSPATGLSNPNIFNPVARPEVTTTYTLTASNCLGSSTDEVVVTVNPLPVADAGADVQLCSGSSIAIGNGAIAGYTYLWTPATGLSDPASANPFFSLVNESDDPVAIEYILTTTLNGCVDVDTVWVTVYSLPVVDAGSDTAITCQETTDLVGTAIGGDGNYSYQWLGGPASATYPGVGAGEYILEVADGRGCINRDTVLVSNSNSNLSVSLKVSDQEICLGDSVIVEAVVANAAGPVVYQWSDTSLHTAGPHVLFPGADQVIKVKITDSLGCSFEDVATVNVHPLPVANAGVDREMCEGNTVSLGVAPVSGYLYSWQPVEGLSDPALANPVASPAKTTTYRLTVTAGECSSTDEVLVTVHPLPVLSTSPDTLICIGDSATLTVTGAATYSWSPSESLNTATGSIVVASPAVTTTYTVVGTSLKGCTDTGKLTVTVQPLPVAAFTYTKDSLDVQFHGIDSNGVDQWSWDFGDRSALSTEQNPQHEYLQKETYTVTLIVINECGSDTIMFQVAVDGSTGGGGTTGLNYTTGMKFNDLRAYPNPFTQKVNVEFVLNNHSTVELQVLDVLGRKVAASREEQFFEKGKHHIEIEAERFPGAGVYYLRLIFGTQSQVIRLVML